MEHGSVTGAAEALRLSQPAVSLAIGSLERQIGFNLFNRVHGRLVPTKEAEFLLADAKNAIFYLQRARDTARSIKERTRGSLVIASYPAIAHEFLPMVLTRFLQKRPGVYVELQTSSSHAVHELLSMRGFDVGIVDTPVNASDVFVRRIELECVCVLPAKQTLTTSDTVTPLDLDGVPFFSIFNGHYIYNQLSSAFSACNSHWNVVVETRLFSSACSLVSRGWGATVVDAVTAGDFRNRDVMLKRFDPRITSDINIIIPERISRSSIADLFLSDFENELQKYTFEIIK